MSLDNLQVVRGEFSMEDPWAVPPSCELVHLRRATDGAVPRLPTTVCLYYDDEFVSAVFSAADDLIVATLPRRDDPLYNEDVVELFLAPEHPTDYYEIEVSPIGTVFDARIQSPQGSRITMSADESWNCEGLVVAIRKTTGPTGGVTIDTLMRVPFGALGRRTPLVGELWSANLFRIDRHPVEGDEYSAWRPTLRQPPDFHVPGAFGRLVF